MDIRSFLAEKKPTDVKVIRRNSSLREAARKMISQHVGALVVTDEGGELVGIISERDLMRAITEYDSTLVDKLVSNVMTRTVITCALHDSIVDVLFQMKSNEIRHIPVLDGAELAGVISIRELTRAYELLQVEANTDALTGLSSRRYFLETLASELDRSRRYGHPLSVAMIDVDRFKRVNDTYGHEVGDEVLRALGNLLVRELRTIDRVGRLGGEEFAAIFPETDIDGAKRACDRLLKTIRAAKIDVKDAKISFTVSIGLVKADPATRDPSGILKRADELLYDAKARGRDRIELDTPHKPPHPMDEDQPTATTSEAIGTGGR